MGFMVAIAGSPRQGNSDRMMEAVIKGLEECKISVEKVVLRDSFIQSCDGCLKCEETGKCHQADDMNQLLDKIYNADGIIIATPVRFDSIPGILKNFIDRLNPSLLDFRLKGKNLGVLVVGQLSGAEGKYSRKKVVKYLKNVAKILGMNFVGSVEMEGRLIGDISSQNCEVCFSFAKNFCGLNK